MDTVRDLVVIVFGVTGTITSLIVLVMCYKLYGRASQALDRLGLVAGDIHDVVEVGRNSVHVAKGVFDAVGPVVLRLGWLRLAFKGVTVLPRVARLISRVTKPPSTSPK